MPSSGAPADYRRELQRFIYRGISLMPQDALPPGKVSFAQNIRSYEEGTIEVRYGLDELLAAPQASPIHSIARLNDPTPFNGGNDAVRLLGVGTDLYAAAPANPSPSIVDQNYSGDPLTFAVDNPFRSPRPYVYVADSDRLRKFDTDLANAFTWGLPTPTTAPIAELAEPQTTLIDVISGPAPWEGYGPNVTPVPPIPIVDRINTTITNILYDTTAPGMASASVASFDNFTPGALITVGGAETVIVQSMHPPVAATTIGAILYDSGTTGPCSIYPDGGFSVGQIEAALPVEYDGRKHIGTDVVPRVSVTRTVDYPVDSLILLGGTEIVRIESIAVGPDGVMSFRCTTLGTFAAGAAITGVASFRAYFTTTRSSGDSVIQQAIEVTLTPPTTGDPEVGGFQGGIGGVNWGLVGNRAATPDDIIRIGFKCEFLGYVEFVRIMLDVSNSGQPYEADYYVYEWRASDLIAAIQATSEATTASFITGQGTAVEQGQTSSIYNDQYAQGTVGQNDPVVGTSASGGQLRRPMARSDPAMFGLSATSPTQWQRSGKDGVSIFQRARGAAKRAIDAAKAAAVSTGASISRQLALGNNVWMTLECRVGDLTRIGTRTDLNLTAISNAAVYVQTLGTDQPILLQMTSPYLVGGFGPDVSNTLPPYVYRASARSTLTGEQSNTSPPMRAGVRPQRNRVEVTVPVCTEPQCDVIDLWRFGGTLARWTYVATAPNDPAASPPFVTFTDDMADGQLDGGPSPRVDLFQPWPVADLPRSGTASIAGTSIQWASGDLFNPAWSADTIIIVNGRATSIYGQPASTTRLQVVDNVGEGTVEWSIPQPILIAQPMPCVWSGQFGNSIFHFGCGDPSDAGVLRWTNANDPDSANDTNWLAVSSASEPLQNGFCDDGNSYVFSTERLYRIVPTPGDLVQFRAVETSCTRGLWSRWAFAIDPDGGCYFLAKDGIYYTSGGSDAKPVTAPDLQPLFPHDGSSAESIRGLAPVDLTQTTRLRLAFVGWNLYFDYVDINGVGRSLLYEPKYDRWTPDSYFEDADASPVTTEGAVVRLSEPGPQVLDHLIACEDGQLYNYTIDKTTDALESIQWAIWTPWSPGADPRAYKQWGDAILDFNPGGSVSGVFVTPVVDNGNVALEQVVLGAGGVVRDTYLVELGDASTSPPAFGYGVLSRNFGLCIEGAVQSCDIQRPIFYLWEPAFLWKGTSIAYRATDWEDLGYKGAKFIQGAVIRANTFGQQKLVDVQFDGPNGSPQTAFQLALLHDGEQSIAYPNADTGWQPFIAELVRLQGADDNQWTLLDWRWIYEPAPEAASQWETQDTTFDLPGFLTVRDGVMAYSADAAITLTVFHDQTGIDYTLPATTNGDYQRVYIPFGPYKGKSVKFAWYSDLPFRLYMRDCSVRIQGWGLPGGYQIVSPFGGPSRIVGAEI